MKLASEFIFKQEVKEEKNETSIVDIESDDDVIEIEFIEITKCNPDNTFVQVSGIPQNLEDDKGNLLQIDVDPLSSESEVQKRQDMEENIDKVCEVGDPSRNCKAGKGWTQLSPCYNKCYLRITENEQKNIFNTYWNEGTFHSRLDYINDMTEIVENWSSELVNNRQELHLKYFLNTSEGRKNVCKRCFCHILGVSLSFLKSVFEKKLCEMKQLSASQKANLELKDLRIELSDIEGEHDDTDADIPETIEISEDELVNKTSSSFSTDDSFLFKTIRQNSKIKPELRISGPSCKFLRDNNIGKGWTRLIPCPNDCFLKITEVDQKNLFSSYWKDATFQSRFKFLNDMLQVQPIENGNLKKLRNARIKRYNAQYNVSTSQGPQQVCSSCFKAALKESDYLIDSVFEKKWCVMKTNSNLRDDGVDVPDIDPIDEEVKNVEDHIKKFPLCESDHFANHSFEKYLPMGLSIKTMYELYKREVPSPVPTNVYQNILVQTDLKFRPNYFRKCEKCEIATQQFRISTDPEEKSKLNYLLTSHLVEAREGQDSKSQDEKIAKLSKNSLLVCSFALQMSLPTPFLKEPTFYYKRPLWTYNLTIQQQDVEKHSQRVPKFYMWHEAHGKKTANEIASCLYQYLQNLPSIVTSVIFYSSNIGENRSKSIAMMFTHLINNHKSLKAVDHKFLISGHSQIQNNLENGWDEAIMKDHHGRIQEPKDWYDVFEKPFKPKNEPEVIVMTPDKFYDFERLWKDQDDPFIDEKVKWLRYTKGVIYYKTSWMEKHRFNILNFKSQSHLDDLSGLNNIFITEEKKEGLLELLPYLSPKVKSFYERLPVRMSVYPNVGLVKEIFKNQESKSSPLKRKLKEISNEENNDPKETCTINEKVIGNDTDVINGEKSSKLKKIPNEIEIVFDKEEDKIIKDDQKRSGTDRGKTSNAQRDNKSIGSLLYPARLPFCKNECCLKVTEDDQKSNFNSYRTTGTFESRINFINDLTEFVTPTYRYKPRSRYITKFYLNTKQGRKFVCKSCFRLVLDVSDSFISTVLNSKWDKINSKNMKAVCGNEPDKYVDTVYISETLKNDGPDIEERKNNHLTVDKIKEVEDKKEISVNQTLFNKDVDSNDCENQENGNFNSNLPKQTSILKEEVIIDSGDREVEDEKSFVRSTKF